jgi:hypothetical protein
VALALAASQDGDEAEARRLVLAALKRDAQHLLARALLQRLNRAR